MRFTKKNDLPKGGNTFLWRSLKTLTCNGKSQMTSFVMWSYANQSTQISSVETKYLALHSVWLVRPRYLFPIGGKSQVLSRCLNVPMFIYWWKHRSKRLHQCDQVNKSHLCTLLGRRQSKKEEKKRGWGGDKNKAWHHNSSWCQPLLPSLQWGKGVMQNGVGI